MENRTVRRALAVMFALLAAFALSGCAKKATPSSSTTTEQTGASSTASETSTDSSSTEPFQGVADLYTPTYKPNGKEIAVIKTSKGVIKVQLFGADAPINTGSFIELAQKGFYAGIKFHRFLAGFVIQGGDPQTRDLTGAKVAEIVDRQNAGQYLQGEPAIGTGGPGYVLKGEFASNPHKHVDGTLAMARSQADDSAGSQFYFTLGPQPSLDNNYTVIGQTISGLDVVHKLTVGDVIESVTIENVAK